MTRFLRYLFPIFIIFVSGTKSLKLLNLSVPSVANFDGTALLFCDFDLEGHNLYSVKWYKDDYEFFSYMPDNSPPKRAPHVSGVIVDLPSSGKNKIILRDLSFNTSGIYRCEVSTEGPSFRTVGGRANMTVMALPRDDPMIEGILTSYLIGDYISANCTSLKTNPPSILSWYINGEKVNGYPYEPFPPTDETDSQGLHTRTLGLKFQVKKKDFQGPRRSIELRCTATVGDLSWHRVVTTSLGPLINNSLSPERLSNKGSCRNLQHETALFVILVLLTLLS